ncbi:LON peptidase substrate-binding domain-containing protein [Gordonia sp. CPCC 205333]|uniref:LON peptidase substrate-binding domain-containing protein n=1 Tax=Gordonia sp. CPCC 205333 TaxID=3140790 RepID=UPI003AF40339
MTEMPMFPLGSALMPGEHLPLRIFEPRYREMLQDCIDSGEMRFGVVLIERGSEVGGGDTRADVGTIAEVVEHQRARNGTWALLCRGIERIRIDEWLDDAPYPRARMSTWPDGAVSDEAWNIWLQELKGKASGLINFLSAIAEEANQNLPIPTLAHADQPATEYTYATAHFMPITQADRQRALCAADPISRAKILMEAIDDARSALQFQLR